MGQGTVGDMNQELLVDINIGKGGVQILLRADVMHVRVRITLY